MGEEQTGKLPEIEKQKYLSKEDLFRVEGFVEAHQNVFRTLRELAFEQRAPRDFDPELFDMINMEFSTLIDLWKPKVKSVLSSLNYPDIGWERHSYQDYSLEGTNESRITIFKGHNDIWDFEFASLEILNKFPPEYSYLSFNPEILDWGNRYEMFCNNVVEHHIRSIKLIFEIKTDEQKEVNYICVSGEKKFKIPQENLLELVNSFILSADRKTHSNDKLLQT